LSSGDWAAVKVETEVIVNRTRKTFRKLWITTVFMSSAPSFN